MHRIPALKSILYKPELLVTIADFHFHKEHPAEALNIYKEVTDMNYANADIFKRPVTVCKKRNATKKPSALTEKQTY